MKVTHISDYVNSHSYSISVCANVMAWHCWYWNG